MQKQSKQTITVKTNEENPEPIELLAEAIIEISNAYKKIQNSRLKKRAILLLIRDMTTYPQMGLKEIELILDTVPRLAEYWLKSNVTSESKK